MQDDEIQICIERPNLAPYQQRILSSPARFTITEAATKIGKTFSHLWWLFEKSHEQIKPGTNYWWIAPVYSQAEIAFKRIKRVAGPAGYKINESKLFIETPTDSTIWFKSAQDPDNLYGEDVYGAVFDEFTRAKLDAWIALRTTLTATKAPCKFIGNVKGKKNWGYKLGQKARAGEPGYEYFRITAMDAVREGILDAEEIEQARRDLPDHAFRELYLAEALDDQANPFGMKFIERQIKPISHEYPVCFGVDLAKSVDWTVVVGLDRQGDIAFYDRWQSDWSQTMSRVKSIVGSSPAYVDSTGVGSPIVEELQKECGGVEGYFFTSQSKQQLMESLAAAVQNAEVSILEGVMREEMEAYEFEYTRRGVRYTAPEGTHDDTVCALALANLRRSRGVGYHSFGAY